MNFHLPAWLRISLFWAVLAGLSFAGLGRSLWTPDEPREAEIGREMLLNPGFVPHLNSEPFLEKPPLYYWALAGAYKVGGVSAMCARAVSGLAGFLTLVLVFFWMRRDTGMASAETGVFLLATCVQFFQSTHWVLLDPLLMLFITLATWGAWSAMSREPTWSALCACYGGLCLAIWTKGLVGPALFAFGLTPFLWLQRRDRPWKSLRPVWGGVALVLITGACLAAFYAADGAEALRELVWVNHVLRLVHPSTTGHAQPVLYYLQALPVALLPWLGPFIALFVPSFWQARLPDEPPSLRLFLGAAVAGGFLMLSLASTKRETYLLPLLPPLCMLMGLAVQEAFAGSGLAGRGQAARRALWGALQPAVLILWGMAIPAVVIWYTKSVSLASGALIVLAFSVGSGGLVLAWRGDIRPAWDLHRTSALIACAAALTLAVPVAEPMKDMAPFCSWISASVSGHAAIPTLGADETLCGIMPFTTGRGVECVSAPRWEEMSVKNQLPDFILEQRSAQPSKGALSSAGFILMGEKTFGRERTLSLWKRFDLQRNRKP